MIFAFPNDYEVIIRSQIYYICPPCLFLPICDHFISCLADIFVFPHFMPITFEIVHTCVSIHIVNTYEVLCDNCKYFTFGNHICSLTSMIIYVFFPVQTYLVFSHLCQLLEIVHMCEYLHNVNAKDV